jgi:hypothetical protein
MGPPADDQEYQQRVQGWMQVLQNPQAQELLQTIARNRGIGAFGARLAENLGTPGTTPLASLGNAAQAGQAVMANTEGQVLRGALAMDKAERERMQAAQTQQLEERKVDISQQRADDLGAYYRAMARGRTGGGRSAPVPPDMDERMSQIAAFIGPIPSPDDFAPGIKPTYEDSLAAWQRNAREMWGRLYPDMPFPAQGMGGFATQDERARQIILNMPPELRADLRNDPQRWGRVQRLFSPEEIQNLWPPPKPDVMTKEGEGGAQERSSERAQERVNLREPELMRPDYAGPAIRGFNALSPLKIREPKTQLSEIIEQYRTTRDPRLLPNLTFDQLNEMVRNGQATGPDVREFMELKRLSIQNSLNLPSDMSSAR